MSFWTNFIIIRLLPLLQLKHIHVNKTRYTDCIFWRYFKDIFSRSVASVVTPVLSQGPALKTTTKKYERHYLCKRWSYFLDWYLSVYNLGLNAAPEVHFFSVPLPSLVLLLAVNWILHGYLSLKMYILKIF